MQTIYTGGQPTPTANLAINKSRVKLYNKNEKVPTYYLQKGQEFQIELYNPTRDKILAKIHLNGKPIAQGGLVLRPGERVFLDAILMFLINSNSIPTMYLILKRLERLLKIMVILKLNFIENNNNLIIITIITIGIIIGTNQYLVAGPLILIIEEQQVLVVP